MNRLTFGSFQLKENTLKDMNVSIIAWSRYFNELTRIKFKANKKSSIARQQRLDFLDGLSDYIKTRKTKKFYILELLDSKTIIKLPLNMPNLLEVVTNHLLLMIVPSVYAMTNANELMAETIGFLAEGREK